ncbi:MAG: hypothetical protein ACR2MY_09830, partial [Candidatus Dormibacteria bacterium]
MTLSTEGLDPEAHQNEALDQIAAASDEASLEELRVRFLGRRAALSAELSRLGSLPPEDRRGGGGGTPPGQEAGAEETHKQP